MAGILAVVVAVGAGLAGCQSTGTGAADTTAAATSDAGGYYLSRQKDLELARKVGRLIEKTYAPDVARVSVKVKPVGVPEADRPQVGGAKTVEALDSLVVSVPHALVASRDKATASTFGQVGNYLSSASGGAKVVVSTQTQKEFDYIVSSIRGGYVHDVGAGKVGYEFRPVARGTPTSVVVVPV